MTVRTNRTGNAVLRIATGALACWPGGRRAPEPGNVLVVRLGNVGDLIVALPAFHAVRKLYPKARLTLLTSPTARDAPGAQEVLANDATFDDIIVYYADESGRPGFLKGLRNRIAESGIDLAIVLPNHLTGFRNLAKHLMLLWTAGVRRFAGFRLVTPADYEIRQVDRLTRLVGELGSAEVEPLPWLTPSEADVARADRLLSACGAGPVIGMHCGAKRPANRWSPDGFAEVGSRLVAERGAWVVLTGSAGEKALTAEVAARIGRNCVDLSGQTSIGGLTAVARRCRVFVSNDTGAMHVAYAVGTPTVAIFGSRFYPNIWYPYGERQIVLRGDAECALCDDDVCALYEYPACLAQVTPDMVVQAVYALLSDSATNTSRCV